MHPRLRRSVPAVGISLLVCALAVARAAAQIAMHVEVSTRSAGLGGASSALFWGEERDHWANPALLGYEHGLRYEHGDQQVTGTYGSSSEAWARQGNVVVVSDAVELGVSGLGIAFSGQPWGQGGVNLDYGTQPHFNSEGFPVGTFHDYESVHSWGFGVSVLAALDGMTAHGGIARRWDRYGDVSFGMNFKDYTLAWAGTETRTTESDYGLLVRLTPFDGLASANGAPVRVDLSYGYSPISGSKRQGFGAHVAADPMRGKWPRQGIWSALAPGFAPLLSVGLTSDWDTFGLSRGYNPTVSTNGTGVELTLARVFSIRTGVHFDPSGAISNTRGWSVGLPIGPWGGGYYEEATTPQARNSGLSDVHRQAFGMWVDVVAIWRSAHGAGS